jgi:antitoxin YefM
MTTLTITKARNDLLDLPDRLERSDEGAVEVTKHGRPVLAVLRWDLYESLVETLEILSDPEMASSLRESLEDIKNGRLVSHEEARKRLGL